MSSSFEIIPIHMFVHHNFGSGRYQILGYDCVQNEQYEERYQKEERYGHQEVQGGPEVGRLGQADVHLFAIRVLELAVVGHC